MDIAKEMAEEEDVSYRAASRRVRRWADSGEWERKKRNGAIDAEAYSRSMSKGVYESLRMVNDMNIAKLSMSADLLHTAGQAVQMLSVAVECADTGDAASEETLHEVAELATLLERLTASVRRLDPSSSIGTVVQFVDEASAHGLIPVSDLSE